MERGDFIGATGPAVITKTGEQTILAEQLAVLTKATRPLPEKWHGLQDMEIRYRQRYVDLISNPEVREVFLKRTAIVKRLRRFLATSWRWRRRPCTLFSGVPPLDRSARTTTRSTWISPCASRPSCT